MKGHTEAKCKLRLTLRRTGKYYALMTENIKHQLHCEHKTINKNERVIKLERLRENIAQDKTTDITERDRTHRGVV